MKKQISKTAAFLLAVALTAGQTPAALLFNGIFNESALTAYAEVFDSGSFGENLTWSLDDDGTLTITGNGTMDEEMNEAPWISWTESITRIVIGSGVKFINGISFERCSNLNEIVLDSDNQNYCSVDGVLFSKDKKELVVYPFKKSETEYVVPDGVTSIGNYAFMDCIGLTKVTLPDSVSSIGNNAFYHCPSLTSFTIPDGVTSISRSAFSGNCTNLTSITLPDSVTDIESYAFRGSGLTSITIPNSVTKIDSSAFEDCKSLTSITIPASVKSVGYLAFDNCTNLTSIIFEGKTPPEIKYNLFDYASENKFFYVPMESIDDYKALPGLSDYLDRINTNQLADGEYKQTAEKDGKYYTRFVYVMPKAQLADMSTAKFTTNYDGKNYTYETNRYYGAMISNGVTYTPLSANSVLFIVTVCCSSDISSNLTCTLALE